MAGFLWDCSRMATYASFGLAILVAINIIYCRYFHPLSRIPGPFLASITRLWLVCKSCTWNIHRIEVDLHQKYGTIVRISPNEIVTSDPRHLKLIYGAGTHFTKAPWYEAIEDPDPNSFSLIGEFNVEKYRYQRRLIRPSLALQTVKRQESYMDSGLRHFVQKMKSLSDAPQDLVKWMDILAAELLTRATFGSSPDLIESSVEAKSVQALDEFWKDVFIMGHVPWLMRIQRLFTRSLTWRSLMNLLTPGEPDIAQSTIFQWYHQQIMSRRSEHKGLDRNVGLHGDLEWQSMVHPDLSADWVYGATMSIIGAGVETSGNTLSAFLFYVSTTGDCQARLHQELQRAYDAGELDEFPSYEQTSKLAYLEACIKEAQRIQPAVGMSLARAAPKGGVIIDGHRITEGTVIGINPFALHRCKEVFGADVNEFRPSRYAEAGASQRSRMESVSLAFGGTSRSCPGQHLAWVLLLKTCAAIILHFEVEVAKNADSRNLRPTFREQCFFYVKWEGLWLRMRPRK